MSATNQVQRNARGQVLPGSKLAKTHGLYSDEAMREFEAQGADLLRQALVDEGEEPPARRRALLEYRCLALHPRILALNAALSTGMFDKRNKLRVSWVTKLESLISQARAIDAALGLERRAKDISRMSAAEWLEAQRATPAGTAGTIAPSLDAEDSRA